MKRSAASSLTTPRPRALVQPRLPSSSLGILPATSALARQQARWIVSLEPWLSLGYEASALGRWLAGQGDAGHVLVLRTSARRPPTGIVVFQKDVLLGWFVPLLAVRPVEAGRGHGRALLGEVARQAFASRRWLYVSCDAANTAAFGFYAKLGFTVVGRLPDMVCAGREELLLRIGRDAWQASRGG